LSDSRPLLGITLGDPTGVGPEIVVQSLAWSNVHQECKPIVIGRAHFVQQAIKLLKLDTKVAVADSWESVLRLVHRTAEPSMQIASSDPSSARDYPVGEIICLQAGSPSDEAAAGGTIDARGGQSAYDALLVGTKLCLASKLDAIVTSPLQKKALQLAGHDWPGHTELLAHLCHAKESAMMLYLPPGQPKHGGLAGLGVVHVTLHMALKDVFQHITQASVFEKIELTHRYFSQLRNAMGLKGRPKIAVAALNPHCGESGRFGDEETTLILPAVQRAQHQGYDTVGPLAVDTLMPKAVQGAYDAVVAMYHDQGHIALKLVDMYEAVNITLGLPIVRTSVAHGTAHDIAWEGRAEYGGMTQAILAAARLARNRRSLVSA
jgi:4-phospho-D-threonate 3-dehydrogenase / 4-phospho-D-erythronate 3-dehydrogenase